MKTLYKIALVFSFLLVANPVFSQTGQTSTNETTSVTADTQNRDSDDDTASQESNIKPNTPVDSIEDSINSESQGREGDEGSANDDSNIQPETSTDNLEDSIESSTEVRADNANPQESEGSQSAADGRDSNDATTQQIRDSFNESQAEAAATTPAINISHSVQLVPQRTRISCWAASAAMIVGWRDRVSIDPEEIARGVGYWSRYYVRNGLPADDVRMFHYWGIALLPAQTRTVQGFAQELEAGPLWVGTDGGTMGHVIVVAGMRGDGTPDGTLVTIYDPWEQGMTRFRSSNRGSIYSETYTQFVARQERLINRTGANPNVLYLAR